MSSVVRAYRLLLRELLKSSIAPRASRNTTIRANLRNALLDRVSEEPSRSRLLKDMQNTVAFLSANRMHKALLERYNPLHDLTEEERIRATARRVGLDTPVKYEP